MLEEIHAAGCYAAACHAQMYTMGTLLRHGSAEQKTRYLPPIARGELRLQAFGVTEPTTGTDTTKLKTRAVREGDHYVVTGQKVWTSRALHSDLMLLLARTTPRRSGEEEDRRPVGVPGRHPRVPRQGARDPPAQGDDQPQHHRSLLRRHARAGREPDRRGRPGLPLHPRRHERRADPRLARVDRRRALVHPHRVEVRHRAHRVRPADRPEPGHPVSDRARLRGDARRPI